MLETLIDTYGDGAVLAMAGALVGVIFGAAAQHSRFCLRAATIEVAERGLGPRLSIWIIAFSAGVLSATGNLRALVTGLVLTIVAQSALRGALSPAREGLAKLWLVPGGEARSILSQLGMSPLVAAGLAALVLIAGFALALARHVRLSHAIAGMAVGLAVGLGWLATFMIAQTSFEVIPISSVTFTGPSTDTLMGLVNSTSLPLSFGVGLVPGVFAGAAAMALATSEWKIERFGPDTPMERYLVGAALMGFGSMRAGGCAVGAGMSGGAIFALTAWVAVTAMWIGAVATHVLLNPTAMRPALG
jgi:hypothetical protein